jgi:Tfp pilus assembly protein PilV
MKHTLHTQPRGVILLEAIVAIGVLVTVIGAVLGLTLRASNVTHVAIDQVVATYLAQDMAEWLVAKRQYNKRNNIAWDTGIFASGDLGISTDASLQTGVLGACSGLNNCALYRTSTGVYTHSANSGANTLTPFQRTVTARDTVMASGDGIEYTITVSWNTGSYRESFVMRTVLYK